MKKFWILIVFIVVINNMSLFAQNVAITDDDAYSVNSSAMLDVKSTTKGMLVPRLTTAQRTAVASPATGLLVFDTDAGSFYFYNGSAWVNLTSGNASGILGYTAPDKVYLNDVNDKFGVGTIAPKNKLDIKADASNGIDQAIFNVVNSDGDTIFAVYPQGVRINVLDEPTRAASTKGGFAVGGFSPTRGTITEYLRVTPDSVRVYFEEDGARASSTKGGFAVGGFSPTRGTTSDFLRVTDDSTRIYTTGTESGFGVEDGSGSGYMKLTPENYFIGHEAGEQITSGRNNTFLGYQAGKSNIEGWDNIFIGYQAGYSNIGYGQYKGANNIFIGNKAGYHNKAAANDEYGHENIFIGKESGYNNVNGPGNLFIGVQAGYSNIGDNSNDGGYNIFIGNKAGYANRSGANNVYIGLEAGKVDTSGFGNSYIGLSAGGSAIGYSNAFVGANAGSRINGNANTCLGSYAGSAAAVNNNIHNNTLVGYSAGQWLITGSDNVVMGKEAGYYFENGSNNVFIGSNSGYSAGSSSTASSGNVFIGFESGYYEEGSNLLYIDNSSTSLPLVYGNFSTNSLIVNGSFKATGILYDDDGDAGTNGQVLSSVVSGTDWISLPVSSSFSGSGTTSYLAKFTGTESVGNSLLYDNGTNLGIGTTSPATKFEVSGAPQSASIPGTNSTGVFRIAVSDNEAIDFGQMASSPWSAWMQVGYAGTTEPLSIQPLGGNVGIGTTSPTRTLDVNGNARIGTNGTTIANIIKVSVVKDLPSISADASSTQTFAVANAAVGSTVYVSPANALNDGLIISYARVSSTGTIEVKFRNVSAAAIDAASMNYYITVIE